MDNGIKEFYAAMDEEEFRNEMLNSIFSKYDIAMIAEVIAYASNKGYTFSEEELRMHLKNANTDFLGLLPLIIGLFI